MKTELTEAALQTTLHCVIVERFYQIERWGFRQQDGTMKEKVRSAAEWLVMLRHYCRRAETELATLPSDVPALVTWRKITALALAAQQQSDERKVDPEQSDACRITSKLLVPRDLSDVTLADVWQDNDFNATVAVEIYNCTLVLGREVGTAYKILDRDLSKWHVDLPPGFFLRICELGLKLLAVYGCPARTIGTSHTAALEPENALNGCTVNARDERPVANSILRASVNPV